jgi:hypothetical protein
MDAGWPRLVSFAGLFVMMGIAWAIGGGLLPSSLDPRPTSLRQAPD